MDKSDEMEEFDKMEMSDLVLKLSVLG